MVQRTAPCRPTTQAVKPERRHQPPSHGQHQGAGDAKAKKKVVPIEITDVELQQVQVCRQTVQKRHPPPPPPAANRRPIAVPNYMKPTRSSDARKEGPSNAKLTNTSVAGTLQPGKERSHLAATGADKKSSNASSSSPAAPVLKAARVLKRKPTFKALKLAAKKAAGVSLPPKQSVNRATCSSTLKDSRFPVALDLNPGESDAEGTSVMKVCPYSYCSLNGHKHEPLPPLKGFLSSRRKLLRAQRSMKLKGLSPFRKQGSGKGAGDMDTGQSAVARTTRSGREIACLIDELVTDFFVEIYTRPEEQVTEIVSGQGTTKESPVIIDESEGTGDVMECFNSEEDHESSLIDNIHETCSDESFEGGVDRNSDISIEELEMMMKFLEYVSCDQQAEADKVEESNTAPEEYEDLNHGCSAADGLSEGIKDAKEAGTKVEEAGNDLEEDANQFPDDKSVSSAYSWGSFCPTLGDLFENENLDVESSLEPGSTLAPEVRAEAAGELYCEEQEDVAEVGNTEIVLSTDAEVKFSELAEPGLLERKDTGELVTEASEPHYSDKKCSDLGLCQEVYLEAEGSLTNFPMPESDSVELEDTAELDDQSKDDADNLCLPTGSKRLGNKKIMKDEEFEDDQNNRGFNIMRRPVTEELDDMNEFNPRAPNFLPEVPDPDAEKVDLKHQMMDERKNAEEWMIDYALQQAVTKLGTRRKQKVSLLVEAFETVLPLPLHEKEPVHAAPSFADSRPIQACN